MRLYFSPATVGNIDARLREVLVCVASRVHSKVDLCGISTGSAI